ncbi:Glycerol-3-phosphate phosphatase [Halotydeus destructor]|nr:Glycerol-3-phosphate phosphatase [Halotydeus destructor]
MLSRSEILDTLKSAGVANICLENIYTSFLVTAIYVKQKINSGTVYVFDSYQFADELDLLNISHIGTGPDVGSKGSKFVPSDSEIDSSVEAVFVHTDKYVNQRKLSKAITYGGKVKPDLLIGLDGQPPDSPNSWSLPNGGHYIQLVAKATKRQPVVCMKPSKIFLDMMRIMEPNIDPETNSYGW